MTISASKFAASAALAGALVLGGASAAFGQDNGSNGSNGSGPNGSNGSETPVTTPTTETTIGETTTTIDTGGGQLALTGTDGALALGGAGAMIALAYAARRAAQARI